MSERTLTIGIPTRNRAESVRRLLQMCLAQSRRPHQIVVSDNASTDDTSECLRDFDGPLVKVLRQSKPLDMVANWNVCLSEAESEWFLLLPDDDRIACDYVEHVERALSTAPNADLLIMRCRVVDIDTGRIDENRAPISSSGNIDFVDRLLPAWLDGSFSLPLAGMIFRRSRLQAAGGFSSRFAYAADTATWLPIALRGPCAFWPEAKAEYVVHTGMSTNEYPLETLISENIEIGALVSDEIKKRDLADREKNRRLQRQARKFALRMFAYAMIYAARRRKSKRELWRAWACTARRVPRYGLSALSVAALLVPRAWMEVVGAPYRYWTRWRQERAGLVRKEKI